ncbi:MAG: hypothetical protein GTO08_04985, partial [Deltaproteobacteria bacterium]|nr:hypothetical protein [Deltaproteobacteria bacterium]
QGITLDFHPAAMNQDLGPAYACFFGKEGVVTGTFELSGGVNGQGKGDDLIRSLTGNLDVSAK